MRLVWHYKDMMNTYTPMYFLTNLLTYSSDFGAARLDPCELRTVVPYTYTLSERSAELHGHIELATTARDNEYTMVLGSSPPQATAAPSSDRLLSDLRDGVDPFLKMSAPTPTSALHLAGVSEEQLAALLST
ncbi:hypothetical protein EVAR_45301_1 [Eumeta japonica]|uniref:Uncharacterized protein n=1 Tax=Eumeta variegata TaxID=151549 RepID=A0A4C1Y7S7_EUMVA|nr:hypothetical protein EVAR_45301_1 [Eumeta japonica]